MRITRGDRWWKTRFRLGPVEASAIAAFAGMLLGIGLAWWLESLVLIPLLAIISAAMPFLQLADERARRESEFSRRYQRIQVMLFLVIANVLIWSDLYLGGGRLRWRLLGLALFLAALLIRVSVAVVWGLILAIRQHHKPRKFTKRTAYDLLD